MMDVVKEKGDWSENEIKVFNEEAMRKLSSVFRKQLSNQGEEEQSPNRT